MGIAVGLNEGEWLGARFSLCDFQDSCCFEKHEVLETVGEAFEFATGLVSQDAAADAGPLAEFVSVKNVLATVQVAAKNAKECFALLR